MIHRTALLKVTASALIIGATLAGCSSTGSDRPSAYSSKTEKALAKGKLGKALSNAENAVSAEPRNAAYRTSLAKAYLANGRFMSAARTFHDAIELGDVNARNVISLALSQIGMGRQRDAIDTLNAHRTLIPNGDYGLAIALAGQTERGVDVLVREVRSGANTPKVRQNLAMAFALNGNWRQARAMALQDVSPAEVGERLLQWVQMSRPEHYQVRVASILGVTPRADAGQPQRLALANTPDMPELVENIADDDAQTELSFVDSPITEEFAMASAAEANNTVAPLIPAVREAVKVAPAVQQSAKNAGVQRVPAKAVEVESTVQSKKQRVALAKSVASAPVFTPRRSVANADRGNYVVQLGAFSSPSNAKRGWDILSKRYGNLRGFSHASATVNSKGRQLHRLAATGFGNVQAARAMCNSIKAQGGNCFVRHSGSFKPMRINGSRLAMRH
ncbi:SPOR domain-containing protein [Sphingorhabdus sp. Alg239-R122]|uniref:SPOR domain-containing protein n=1 Tax=Sphingorhabdus sp. Alg239-R122 TaxID=2305989 RepID=UPI0013DB11FB|nr:SPOR domain-containing protein [Sphingorhabdus sp. Alg239-R122]